MKLYCGTYAKYNEGNLAGKWLDLDDYIDNDDFMAACLELHKDEDDPELMFQDCECEYDWEKSLYSESGNYEDYYEVIDALDRHGVDEDVFSAWLEVTGEDASYENVEICSVQYCGKFSKPEDFAYEIVEEQCNIDKLPSLIRSNINFHGVWEDLEDEGYKYENGYIFNTWL